MTPLRTRFAPSPTGQLHLGHVAAMAYVWGLASRHGAAVDLRIEDHDRERCRPEYTAELESTLDWLGFRPLSGGQHIVQSTRAARFEQALARLRDQQLVYVCRCSRKDLLPARDASSERVYPGKCRELNLPESPGTVLRVRLPADTVEFYDGRHGWQSQQPAAQCGDPVIRDRLGQWTYQFAVVVDDLEDYINWIIRGDDLLTSTARQLLLARYLGRTTPLHVFHHPLIVNPDGSKLSKRDQAAPLADLRRQGLSPNEIIGLAVRRCGLSNVTGAIDVADLAGLCAAWGSEQLFAHPFVFDGA
ncbi:MAG: hypothetical protein JSS02_02225 [Planctomycetes bacterium]|nr:hypothetical protein [Planctomycetota bacterium]